MAAMPTTPTTTPAAMAALLVPPELCDFDAVGDAWLAAVTTIVCPASVTTEGACVLVVVGAAVVEELWDEDDADPPKLFTDDSVPLRETDQAFGPPPRQC